MRQMRSGFRTPFASEDAHSSDFAVALFIQPAG